MKITNRSLSGRNFRRQPPIGLSGGSTTSESYPVNPVFESVTTGSLVSNTADISSLAATTISSDVIEASGNIYAPNIDSELSSVSVKLTTASLEVSGLSDLVSLDVSGASTVQNLTINGTLSCGNISQRTNCGIQQLGTYANVMSNLTTKNLYSDLVSSDILQFTSTIWTNATFTYNINKDNGSVYFLDFTGVSSRQLNIANDFPIGSIVIIRRSGTTGYNVNFTLTGGGYIQSLTGTNETVMFNTTTRTRVMVKYSTSLNRWMTLVYS